MNVMEVESVAYGKFWSWKVPGAEGVSHGK